MAFANISPSLLDEDLATSDKSKKFLRVCLNESKKIIPAGSLLQLQHILNISVPKEDRELPRSYHPGADVLKVVMSDGDYNIYALMNHSSPELSMNTPPGTKIRFLKPVTVNHGTFCLSSDTYEVLGGHVPKLVEKWTMQRKINIKQEWGCSVPSSGGPPLWKPFGYNATSGIDVAALRKMKAMDIVNEQREGSKQAQGKKTQFEVQRDQALEEVRDKSLKQNWCPPAKNLMDKELVELLREGFPLEEAEEALKKYKNPRKALQHLKDTNKVTKFREEQKSQPTKEKTKWRNAKADDEDAEVPREYQRPSKSISLFGFIEQHIKPETASKTDDDQNKDYQLALSMSVDSFKRENKRSNSRYDGESEFPSLHDKTGKSKSQSEFHSRHSDQANSNDAYGHYTNSKYSRQSPKQFNDYNRNQKQPTIKRDYPASHKQYESSNRYNRESSSATDSKYKQSSTYRQTDSRRGGSDYNQRDKSSNDFYQDNYNRGGSFGNFETPSNNQSQEQQTYPNRSYGSFKNNDSSDSRQNYYYDGNDESKYESKNNEKYQNTQKKPLQTSRTFSYSRDKNSENAHPFMEMNEFRSKGKDDSSLLNQRTYNEFKSGDSSRGFRDDRNTAGNDYRQSYSGRGYNNRSNDTSEVNSWRQTESKGINEYQEGDFSSGFGEYRDTSSASDYKKVDTVHNTFDDSSYRDQSKANNDYQNSRRGGGGSFRRFVRGDFPDRDTDQYNRQSDNPGGYSESSSGGQYNSSQNSRDARGYSQNQTSGVVYSNSAKTDREHYSESSQPKSEPYSSSSFSYNQGRQVQKGKDEHNSDGSNYSRQTMVFTRSNNGDNGQQDYQRDVYQVGQGIKSMQVGHNSQSYHQKSYNNQY